MKKMILTLVALLSMTAAQAQDNNKSDKCECKKEMRHGKERKQMTPEEMTDRMAKDLSLTDAQKSKVLALNKEYQDVLGKRPHMKRPQKPQADGESGATEQQDRPQRPQLTDAQKAEMKQQKAKREEYAAKLKKILNDDQYEKYEKMQKHHRGHGGPGRHGRPHGPRPMMEPMD